jgi:hypothetical protein
MLRFLMSMLLILDTCVRILVVLQEAADSYESFDSLDENMLGEVDSLSSMIILINQALELRFLS